MTQNLPQKMRDQMKRAGLPAGGQVPFIPRIVRNRRGNQIIEKATVQRGPKKGKKGYVDTQGRIWIKDRAHAEVPDHWDVQLDGGKHYTKVDVNGDIINCLSPFMGKYA